MTIKIIVAEAYTKGIARGGLQAGADDLAKAVIKQCASAIRDRWEGHIQDGKPIEMVYEATQCELAILAILKEFSA
jgi:cyanophycinase-like exopeptidase